MKAEYEVRNDLPKRTIVTRMKGIYQAEDMLAWARDYRVATDSYNGRSHMVIADMRGMKAMRANVAEILGAAIGYGRTHGVILCAHISDDTVQRLQAARIARMGAANDEITLDVVSMEEAERACDDARHRVKASVAQMRVHPYSPEGAARDEAPRSTARFGRPR